MKDSITNTMAKNMQIETIENPIKQKVYILEKFEVSDLILDVMLLSLYFDTSYYYVLLLAYANELLIVVESKFIKRQINKSKK